jgi:hypothetical protein
MPFYGMSICGCQPQNCANTLCLCPLRLQRQTGSLTSPSPTPPHSGPGYANLHSRVFFLWGSFCFVCIAFVYFMIYETKGLTLEQLDELYGIVSKAWRSKAFRPEVSFAEVQDVMDGGKGSLVEAREEVERRRSGGEQV